MYAREEMLGKRGAGIRSWIDTHRPLSAGLFAAGVMSLFFLYLYSQIVIGEFELDFVIEHFPAFIDGMLLTLRLTGFGFIVGMALGFLTAYARVSSVKVLKGVAKGYVDVFRGTPILIQIFLWNVAVLPLTPGYRYQGLLAGILALTINTGAYQAEIFRGGLKAIQQGQIEAGQALGFTPWKVMRHIKLPQTLRLIIPPMTNEFIALLKASALLSAIAIVEMSFVAQHLAVRFFQPFEPWTVVTLLYLSMTVPLAKLVQYLEIRFRIPGLGLPTERARARRGAPRASETLVHKTQAFPHRRRNLLYERLAARMRETAVGG